MRENMPGTHGWVGRGPASEEVFVGDPDPDSPEYKAFIIRQINEAARKFHELAGPVTITTIDVEAARSAGIWPPASAAEVKEAISRFTLSTRVQAAYSSKQVADIVEQGRIRPRLATMDERRLAQKNRQDSREAAEQFEQWAKAACGVSPSPLRIPLHSEFIPEK